MEAPDPVGLDKLPEFETAPNVLLLNVVSILVVDNCALEYDTGFGDRTEDNENDWKIDMVMG